MKRSWWSASIYPDIRLTGWKPCFSCVCFPLYHTLWVSGLSRVSVNTFLPQRICCEGFHTGNLTSSSVLTRDNSSFPSWGHNRPEILTSKPASWGQKARLDSVTCLQETQGSRSLKMFCLIYTVYSEKTRDWHQLSNPDPTINTPCYSFLVWFISLSRLCICDRLLPSPHEVLLQSFFNLTELLVWQFWKCIASCCYEIY